MSAEKLYMVVDEKFNQISIVEKSEFANVGVIDKASVPFLPVSPVLSINLLLGALFGFTIGVGIVLVREYLDIRINTPDGLKQRGYAVPFLCRQARRQDAGGASSSDAVSGRERRPSFPRRAHRAVFLRPRRDTGAFGRNWSMPSREPDEENRCDEPECGGGKTTSIINLAIAFAQAERRVLLVDGDLRRPKVHTVLGFDVSPGLGELLAGTRRCSR